MIDLHLHFDGSLLPRTVLELAQEQNIALPASDPDELKLFLCAPSDCGSLNEYLEKFDLPLLCPPDKGGCTQGDVCSDKLSEGAGASLCGNTFCAAASHEEGHDSGGDGKGGNSGYAGGACWFLFQGEADSLLYARRGQQGRELFLYSPYGGSFSRTGSSGCKSGRRRGAFPDGGFCRGLCSCKRAWRTL